MSESNANSSSKGAKARAAEAARVKKHGRTPAQQAAFKKAQAQRKANIAKKRKIEMGDAMPPVLTGGDVSPIPATYRKEVIQHEAQIKNVERNDLIRETKNNRTPENNAVNEPIIERSARDRQKPNENLEKSNTESESRDILSVTNFIKKGLGF